MRKIFHNFFLATLGLGLTFAIIIGIYLSYVLITLPNIQELKDVHLQVPLKIYSATGTLIGEYGTKRRTPISISQVPPTLITAILDTEDQRFYEHNGVDFLGLVRAAKVLISTGQKLQGASTITMQVARNFFLTRRKTYTRKLREILLALKIDHTISKNKVLELYLNKIYLGQRAYGVAAAAQVYYGKSLDQLTLPELAVIAGLPQAPSRDNPINNPDGAKRRRNHVLERMYKHGDIDYQTYQEAINTPITASYHTPKPGLHAPYIASLVKNIMVEKFGNKAYEGGYNVYTTIIDQKQLAANKSLKDGLIAYNKRHPNLPQVSGALVAINPENGAIIALNGGFSFAKSKFNCATDALRQTGSSFKPFVYSAALSKGYTLASTINDAPVVIQSYGVNKLWRPENDTRRFYGPTRLKVALMQSRNLVSIRLLQLIGTDYTINFLQKFGFSAKQLPNSLSLALGTASITPLQMAAAYTIFANGGYKVTPYLITKIVDENGKTIYHYNPTTVPNSNNSFGNEAPRVLSAQNAYLITRAMQAVIKHGTGRAALSLNRQDLAGKTGTTNDKKDAWFAGFNTKLVAVVWVGFNQPQSLHEYGAQAALPIWIDFMKQTLKNTPESKLQKPAGIVTVRIDPKTGLLARPNQSNAIFEQFRQEYAPNQYTNDSNSKTNLDTSAAELF
ncbi:MAG: PBP1A family penicillin-binding protein [Gammaproteobacteria bacterium]|nr:PBP1A family penicillin-binding protein [Gammaproteobacteria bacterium]